jgi:hypothetical protein
MIERIIEGEKKCNNAFSPCTRRVPPSAKGLEIMGSEGLVYLKMEGDRY